MYVTPSLATITLEIYGCLEYNIMWFSGKRLRARPKQLRLSWLMYFLLFLV